MDGNGMFPDAPDSSFISQTYATQNWESQDNNRFSDINPIQLLPKHMYNDEPNNSQNRSSNYFPQTDYFSKNIQPSHDILPESRFQMSFFGSNDQENLFNNLPEESLNSGFSKTGSIAKRRKLDFDSVSFGSSLNDNPFHPETPRSLEYQVNLSNGSQPFLKSVHEIPEKYRSVFPFSHFNALQSKVFEEVMHANNPMVICAPTGSGKTVIFELSIIRLLLSMPNSNYKIVYLAPIKALCSERYHDWNKKFSPLGLNCTELTGDTNIEDFQALQRSHIVFTTPEKWDSMTRRWKDQKSLVETVRLFLIDEVHLLGDDVRGATMEAVVSRMKTIQVAVNNFASNDKGNTSTSMRFLAISATIPNVDDIAAWLDTGILPSRTFSLGDEYRPVSLRRVVIGYPCSEKQSDFKFDLALNYKLSNIIQTYSDNKPTLIFCNTRKGVAQAGSILTKDARFVMNENHKQTLMKYTNLLHDSKLQELVLQGVGFHHAGLDNDDRQTIQDLFLNGLLPVLFCTSTLAMGVNLPAHLVIIKGTMYYGMGGFKEYSEAQVLQMIGRAGRPQFDTSATAVILTKQKNKGKYQNLLSGTQKIESSLHHHLTEHINAEIVLGTITDINIAQEWLKSTFLYIRMCENPKFYGAPGLDKASIAKKLQGMCLRALKSLQALSIVDMKNETLHSTEVGRLMARYCITYETVKLFSTVTGQENIQDLLLLVSKAKEFADIVLRQNERTILNTLNKDKHRATIRFPMNGKIKTAEAKVNCLFQATLGCLSIIDFPLQQDVTKIFRVGQRICKFLMEYMFLHGNFQACLASTILSKCVRARLWENSKFVGRQLERIGPSLSSALVNAGITTFSKIEQTNSRELEMILNRNPPFGDQIKSLVVTLPKLNVIVEQTPRKRETTISEILFSIGILNKEQRAKYLTALSSKKQFTQGYIAIVGDADNKIVFKQKITDSQIVTDNLWTRKITVNRASKSPELSINVICLDYVGLDYETRYKPEYKTGYKQIVHPSSPPKIQNDAHSNTNSKSSSGSPMQRFCDEVKRKTTQFSENRPTSSFKKLKVELTLETNTRKKSIKDYEYVPRKLDFQAVDNTYDQNYEEKRYSSEQSGTSNRGKVSSEQRGYSCGQPVDNTYDQNYEERRYSSEQRGSSNQATFSSERRGYSSGQRRYSVDPHLSVYQQQLPDMRDIDFDDSFSPPGAGQTSAKAKAMPTPYNKGNRRGFEIEQDITCDDNHHQQGFSSSPYSFSPRPPVNKIPCRSSFRRNTSFNEANPLTGGETNTANASWFSDNAISTTAKSSTETTTADDFDLPQSRFHNDHRRMKASDEIIQSHNKSNDALPSPFFPRKKQTTCYDNEGVKPYKNSSFAIKGFFDRPQTSSDLMITKQYQSNKTMDCFNDSFNSKDKVSNDSFGNNDLRTDFFDRPQTSSDLMLSKQYQSNKTMDCLNNLFNSKDKTSNASFGNSNLATDFFDNQQRIANNLRSFESADKDNLLPKDVPSFFQRKKPKVMMKRRNDLNTSNNKESLFNKSHNSPQNEILLQSSSCCSSPFFTAQQQQQQRSSNGCSKDIQLNKTSESYNNLFCDEDIEEDFATSFYQRNKHMEQQANSNNSSHKLTESPRNQTTDTFSPQNTQTLYKASRGNNSNNSSHKLTESPRNQSTDSFASQNNLTFNKGSKGNNNNNNSDSNSNSNQLEKEPFLSYNIPTFHSDSDSDNVDDLPQVFSSSNQTRKPFSGSLSAINLSTSSKDLKPGEKTSLHNRSNSSLQRKQSLGNQPSNFGIENYLLTSDKDNNQRLFDSLDTTMENADIENLEIISTNDKDINPVSDSLEVESEKETFSGDNNMNSQGILSSAIPRQQGILSSVMPQQQGILSSAIPQQQGILSSVMPQPQGILSSAMPQQQRILGSAIPQQQGILSSAMPRQQGILSSAMPQQQGILSSVMPQQQGILSSAIPGQQTLSLKQPTRTRQSPLSSSESSSNSCKDQNQRIINSPLVTREDQEITLSVSKKSSFGFASTKFFKTKYNSSLGSLSNINHIADKDKNERTFNSSINLDQQLSKAPTLDSSRLLQTKKHRSIRSPSNINLTTEKNIPREHIQKMVNSSSVTTSTPSIKSNSAERSFDKQPDYNFIISALKESYKNAQKRHNSNQSTNETLPSSGLAYSSASPDNNDSLVETLSSAMPSYSSRISSKFCDIASDSKGKKETRQLKYNELDSSQKRIALNRTENDSMAVTRNADSDNETTSPNVLRNIRNPTSSKYTGSKSFTNREILSTLKDDAGSNYLMDSGSLSPKDDQTSIHFINSGIHRSSKEADTSNYLMNSKKISPTKERLALDDLKGQTLSASSKKDLVNIQNLTSSKDATSSCLVNRGTLSPNNHTPLDQMKKQTLSAPSKKDVEKARQDEEDGLHFDDEFTDKDATVPYSHTKPHNNKSFKHVLRGSDDEAVVPRPSCWQQSIFTDSDDNENYGFADFAAEPDVDVGDVKKPDDTNNEIRSFNFFVDI